LKKVATVLNKNIENLLQGFQLVSKKLRLKIVDFSKVVDGFLVGSKSSFMDYFHQLKIRLLKVSSVLIPNL
jgi:hypothetical protein